MEFEHDGLLIVGHGSTVNAWSSAPTWAMARKIAQRGIFREVHCAFWKEEPSLRDAPYLFQSVADVRVVPNFISEGYFTQKVIPRELELTGKITVRANGQHWFYSEPVGSHTAMTEILLQHARDAAGGIDLQEAALIVVGHGTSLNDNSALAAKREVARLREREVFGEVLNAYMEEPPLVSKWNELTSKRTVVVVPFFISDGLHSYEDIPQLLGIAPSAGAGANPTSVHHLRGKSLFYSRAIGTDPRFEEVIIEQARNAASVVNAG